MLHLAGLIILGVIAIILCNGYVRSRERHMKTDEFRAHYNKVRKDEIEIEKLKKDIRKGGKL